MGGDTVSVQSSITDDDEDYDYVDDDDILSTTVICNTLEVEANEKRNINSSVYRQVIKSYDGLKDRVENIDTARSKVLSYTPGSWVENVGGMTLRDYNVPKTTTLLLIGPKGSGKSSLVNRISRVFEDDKFAPERAQVTYNASVRDGTRFLQEYMIPRNATSFCLYDTPGFSDDVFENLEMIKQWMTKGVRHGDLVTCEQRRVGFVIFVINGLSVLKSMENSEANSQYMHMVTEVFSSPFLSFKDHKPVIAITHGDLLSISERARVRVYLGDLLGVHPSKQTFDVPDNCEPGTELTVVDLIRYALEHADRNLPCKFRPTISKGSRILLWANLLLMLAVGILMLTIPLDGFHSLKHNPGSVLEPSLEIKEVVEFDQPSVFKPDLGIKTVTEIDPEIVSVPTFEIKELMEHDQGSVSESDMEIKEVIEIDPGIVPVQAFEIKEVMELDQRSVPELDMEIKKVAEFDQESVPKPDLKNKKVTETDPDSVPVPTLAIKKATEFDRPNVPESDLKIKIDTRFDQESVPEPDLGIKKVTEIVPTLEMEKVIPGCIPKPSKKAKKMKKVRAPKPNQDVDWKMMRHLWYEEPNQEVDWKTIRHLW